MKKENKLKKLVLCTFALISAGCSNTTEIKYEAIDNGCVYSEKGRPRRYLFDYFGQRDYDFSVKYHGITCTEMTHHELEHSIHKTPYNGINNTNNINEIPAIKVDLVKH